MTRPRIDWRAYQAKRERARNRGASLFAAGVCGVIAALFSTLAGAALLSPAIADPVAVALAVGVGFAASAATVAALWSARP